MTDWPPPGVTSHSRAASSALLPTTAAVTFTTGPPTSVDADSTGNVYVAWFASVFAARLQKLALVIGSDSAPSAVMTLLLAVL